MSWQSLTLKDSLQDFSQKISDLLNDFNNQLSEAQSLLATLDSKISNTQALLNQNDATIQSLSNTGVKVILLSPSQGIWYDRLTNAQNAPSTSGSLYTVAHASLFVGPSLSSIQFQFDVMLNSIQKDLIPPNVSFPNLSIPSLEPSLENKFQLPLDFWSDTTVGSIFPGLVNTLSKDNAELKKTLQDLSNTKQIVENNISSLQQIINDLQQVLNDLQNTGVFTVTLAPEIGSWIDRLRNEPNAPLGLNYSAGLCVVGTALDLAGITEQYNAILSAF